MPSDTYPFLAESLFMTLTNVNFDPEAIKGWIDETADRRDALLASLPQEGPGDHLPGIRSRSLPAATVAAIADRAASTASTPRPPATSTSVRCSTPFSMDSKE